MVYGLGSVSVNRESENATTALMKKLLTSEEKRRGKVDRVDYLPGSVGVSGGRCQGHLSYVESNKPLPPTGPPF
jgi:hypothetical protein